MNHAADRILREIQRTIWSAHMHGTSSATITLTPDEVRYRDNATAYGGDLR